MHDLSTDVRDHNTGCVHSVVMIDDLTHLSCENCCRCLVSLQWWPLLCVLPCDSHHALQGLQLQAVLSSHLHAIGKDGDKLEGNNYEVSATKLHDHTVELKARRCCSVVSAWLARGPPSTTHLAPCRVLLCRQHRQHQGRLTTPGRCRYPQHTTLVESKPIAPPSPT